VRPPSKPDTRSGSEFLKLEKEKPAQQLGFTPVWMAESNYTAAFPGQSPPKRFKQVFFPLQNCPGHAKKNKKIRPG
jgi:hypothetical protein